MFGLQVRTCDLDPSKRTWVPVLKTPYVRYTWASEEDAEAFARSMKRRNLQMEYEVVAVEKAGVTP